MDQLLKGYFCTMAKTLLWPIKVFFFLIYFSSYTFKNISTYLWSLVLTEASRFLNCGQFFLQMCPAKDGCIWQSNPWWLWDFWCRVRRCSCRHGWGLHHLHTGLHQSDYHVHHFNMTLFYPNTFPTFAHIRANFWDRTDLLSGPITVWCFI